MDRIYLIGMMYAGKSTVGPLLAQRLQWSFRDLDEDIESSAQESIKNLFEDIGEDQFRKIESRLLRKTLSTPKLVLATGGGVILSPENRKLLRNAGLVVFLQTDFDTLCRRVPLTPDRPLLNGPPAHWRTMLQSIIDQREPLYYHTAHLVVNTLGKTPNQIAAGIFRKVANW